MSYYHLLVPLTLAHTLPEDGTFFFLPEPVKVMSLGYVFDVANLVVLVN